jgi:hypothetical protein
MMDLIYWIILHFGAALAALLIVLIWAAIIFVVVDETVALIRGDHNQDGEN